jgi:hypothetical protein
MYFDNYHSIGYTHEECQDFSYSGLINDSLYFGIVGDGCSTSHKHTKANDIGTQILVHCVKVQLKRYLAKYKDIKSFKDNKNILDSIKKDSFFNSIKILRQLYLHTSALDASIIISIYDSKDAYVMVLGDGGFAYKKDDKIETKKIEFSQNAPLYMTYIYDFYGIVKNSEQYLKTFENQKVLVNDEEIVNKITPKNIENIYEKTSFYIEDCDMISVFSDGMFSFLKDNEKYNVLDQIFEYRNLKGVFVQRIMKFLKKKWEKESIHHFDDISISTLIKEKNE